MTFEDGEYYSPSEIFSCINSSMSNSKKKKMMNKRRFSDEQVRSLESIFENETKLEPKKKVQLARELGLQPRQVAIWFQNKRARYKSKQLEHDYTILRANYNALASQFDTLKKEQQALLLQVQKLRDLAGKADEAAENQRFEEAGQRSNEVACNSGNAKSDESENNTNKNDKSDCHEAKPDLSMEGAGSEYGASITSDEGSSENNNYFETDEMEMLKIAEPVVEEAGWGDLRPDGLFDQAVDTCQWWDFWT
ncbi:hypothetical protein Cgig2_031021 [Carnegiea gigantea]|uniref:Homeobox-leucine zipper protein n=1 Tax=Carnegiea gigantea TaxID=171969 RepID=A0A9Q1KCW8_9CARY|nr:hypothetical protein Cgig2_031021 [Carnegiea gigantea]